MKLTLEQFEIEKAISHYIDTKFFALKGKHLAIEFVSGRSPPTVTAFVDILENDILSDKEEPKPEKDFKTEQQEIPFG